MKRTITNSLLSQDWQRAVRDIIETLKDLDDMRRGLDNARYNLGLAVDYAPASVRRDFQAFWQSGGCTQKQYVDWLQRKRPAASIAKRKHLRLVVNNAPPRTKVVRYRPRPTTDQGPDAA